VIPRHELARVLIALGRGSVELAPHPTDPERLRHRPAALRPELADALRTHRAALIALLVVGYAPAPHGDPNTGYVWAERLGIADGLGLATHPGSPAWLVAVGESMWASCCQTTSVVHFGHGTTTGCDPAGG
jgi:hypothetical protein